MTRVDDTQIMKQNDDGTQIQTKFLQKREKKKIEMLTSLWQYSLLTIYQFTLEFSMKISIIVQHMRSSYDCAFSKGQNERGKWSFLR